MFTVPDLTYDYDALNHYISGDIMKLHHDKHHQAYVDKLNAAIEPYPQLRHKAVEDLLIDLDMVPDEIRNAVRNNGGGHYNHCLFWLWMSPDGGGQPTGELLKAIEARYETFEKFTEAFAAEAVGLFGSGWVWLQPDIEISSTSNQDSLLSKGEPAPLLGLDVWEHAYYLDYKNQRPEYVKAWWNVVNWRVVEDRYATFKAQ